jgi:SOS-response transcriptional repressor LexA
MNSLSSRQQSVYDFMLNHLINTHHLPTRKDIQNHCNFRSVHSAEYQVQQLVSKGYLVPNPPSSGVNKYRLSHIKVFLRHVQDGVYVD